MRIVAHHNLEDARHCKVDCISGHAWYMVVRDGNYLNSRNHIALLFTIIYFFLKFLGLCLSYDIILCINVLILLRTWTLWTCWA